MRFLRNLSLSIGLNPTINKRPQQSHQNACAYNITYAGSEYEALHGRACDRVCGEVHERGEFGWLTPVDSVMLGEVETTTVYNLEVEEDHSYVVNGVAVANCVSRGHHQALQHAFYNGLKTGTNVGRAGEIAYEPIYAGSRVYIGKGRIRGEGSVGAWAAQWLAGVNGVGGFCERGVYGSADLRQDNERWAVANSDAGDKMPPELLKELQQHTCLSHRLRNNSEMADCIASRIGIARCWDTLFGDRDANGMSRAASRGAHCQAIIGVFLMRDGKTGFVELQSWGPNNPRGQRVLKYAGGEITLPAGCYGVSEEEYLRAQRGHWEAWASQVRRGEELR